MSSYQNRYAELAYAPLGDAWLILVVVTFKVWELGLTVASLIATGLIVFDKRFLFQYPYQLLLLVLVLKQARYPKIWRSSDGYLKPLIANLNLTTIPHFNLGIDPSSVVISLDTSQICCCSCGRVRCLEVNIISFHRTGVRECINRWSFRRFNWQSTILSDNLSYTILKTWLIKFRTSTYTPHLRSKFFQPSVLGTPCHRR